MKKGLTIISIIICLLFSGCASLPDGSNGTGDNAQGNPQQANVEFSMEGFNFQLDGDNLVVSNGIDFRLFTLPEKKFVKKIPNINEVVGFDISGDIIAWSSETTKSNSEIFVYNIQTPEKTQITNDPSGQFNPKIWKNYIVWQDDRNDPTKEYPGRWSLYLYDLNNGKEKLLTSTLAANSTYNICDNKVVWEDERNFSGDNVLRGGENVPENNKDIYLYDIETEKEIALATGPLMESKPDVYGNYVVWEDRNNGTLSADIVLYNLETKEAKHITKDEFNQGTPKVYENYVVWMDERTGSSSNDIMLGSHGPNSDIFIYDIKNGTERNLTGEGPQVLPSISSNWVVFLLSNQINPVIQAVKYRE